MICINTIKCTTFIAVSFLGYVLSVLNNGVVSPWKNVPKIIISWKNNSLSTGNLYLHVSVQM